MSETITGGCLCGAIRFETSAVPAVPSFAIRVANSAPPVSDFLIMMICLPTGICG